MIKTCNALESNIKRTMSDPVMYLKNVSFSLFM